MHPKLLLPLVVLGLSFWASTTLAEDTVSETEAPSKSQPDAPPPAETPPEAPSPHEAALQASMVLEAHCADVAGATATKSAQALSAVSPALTQVSKAHDATGEAFLLYWRGRLNLCLDREDRAKEDLDTFVAQVGDDAVYTAQAKSATRLLRVIDRRSTGRPTVRTPGLAVAGGVLLGSTGVLAGLSGWQWVEAQESLADFEDGGEPWSEADAIRQQGQNSLTAQRIMVGSAVATGVAGLTSFILSTVVPGKGKAAKAASTTLLVVPTADGGVALSLSGRF